MKVSTELNLSVLLMCGSSINNFRESESPIIKFKESEISFQRFAISQVIVALAFILLAKFHIATPKEAFLRENPESQTYFCRQN